MFICAHVKDRAYDTLLSEDDVEPGSTVHVVVPATAVGMQLMDLGLSICAEVLYHLVGVALDDVDVGGESSCHSRRDPHPVTQGAVSGSLYQSRSFDCLSAGSNPGRSR